MSALNPDVVAAFFAGVAAVLSSVYGIRRVRKGEREACAQRIAELQSAYDRGMTTGLHLSERERGRDA